MVGDACEHEAQIRLGIDIVEFRHADEAVRLIQDRETQLAALDTVIERGLADSDAGRGKPVDEVFDRLEAKYQAMAGQATNKRGS